MGYAIELFYDEASDRTVREIWDGLGTALGQPSLSELGARPHVSLAVYGDGYDTNGFPERLLEFARSIDPFDFTLSSLGTFPGQEGVVFLAPVVTRRLLAVHARFHEVFSKHDHVGMGYYLPGNWVPHCTVAIDLSEAEVTAAVAYGREVFQPILGRFQEIGLVEFRPVKERFTCALG
ncbi:MAG: 2'-5' RNA ligase family protein [Gemmatimonadetes bacterium]|nr:2'-5' RNA ligase family protein [Gemmatimonadota bacterium]MYG86285.1 2'-5' RNA ligase family protein [Gemmatimonadota bacterium]MYJ91018.1 2'-5' RNA ligase family protein [Gemmatimonadota bacterium]